MGRQRRQMNEYGELLCPGCEGWVSIENYYPALKDGPVWYIVDGVEYPKPMSRCKPCMRNYVSKGEPQQVVGRKLRPGSAQLDLIETLDQDPITLDELIAKVGGPNAWEAMTPAERGEHLMRLPVGEYQRITGTR